jgi:hypothetical protein
MPAGVAQFAPRQMPLVATQRCQTGGRARSSSAGSCASAARPCARSSAISDQQFDLTAAETDAEELADQIGQLMRFIQNHRIDAGQQIAEAVFLERQIGQQQMVIDHDDVGFQRRAARLEHMAARIVRAARAGTVLARGADLRAQRMRIGQLRQFGQIAAARGERPVAMRASSGSASAGSISSCRPMFCKPRPAQIIGASLEQRHARRPSQGAGQQRQIAVKELVLQRACAGGNHHTQARQQRRYQVGKGLAGAGAGLHQQHSRAVRAALDARGHLLLRRARAKPSRAAPAAHGPRKWRKMQSY